MDYTKTDLRKFFIAGRRYGLTESSEYTTMSFDKFFEVYSQIQEDIKEEEKARQKQALVDIMEEDSKNGMYDQHKEKWRGWISMKRIEEMKDGDKDKLNQPDKIKIKIGKDSEGAKLVDFMKSEKKSFKETVESGKSRNTESISDEEIQEEANNWVFEKNGHRWSNNDDTAGDNWGSFIAGAKWMMDRVSRDTQRLDTFTEKDIIEAVYLAKSSDLKTLQIIDKLKYGK